MRTPPVATAEPAAPAEPRMIVCPCGCSYATASGRLGILYSTWYAEHADCEATD